MAQREDRMGFFQVVGSVLAALVGVQSEKNRERDFTSGNPFAFIAVGAFGTVVLIVLIMSSSCCVRSLRSGPLRSNNMP